MPLEQPQAKLFGLRKSNQLPAVILENNKNLSCLIQNSDQQSSCRTLQLSLPKENLTQKKSSFSTRLSLLEQESLIDDYLKQEQQRLLEREQKKKQQLALREQKQKQILLKRQQKEKQRLLIKQQKEQQRLLASRTISSGCLKLFADPDTKSIRLYYKDKEVTRAPGLHSSFNDSKVKFGLFNSQWKIQKVSKKRLILSLENECIPVIQIWDLKCNGDNTVEIKLEFKVNKKTFLIDEGLRLELIDEYKRWLTTHEGGGFLISRYIDNIGPVRLKDNKISGVILKPECNRYVPDLTFNCCSQSENRILNIYKRKEKSIECVGIYSAIINPKRKQLINPGRYTYFEGKIVLDKKIKLEEAVKRDNIVELNNDDLRFIFDRGRGRIFWRQKELTAGLCFYTSVRSSGIWYDSYQAVWQVNKIRKNKIVAVGDWPHISISQTWQLELIEENLIYWKAEMELYEQLNLEIEQANVMLSSKYKSWAVSNFIHGEFLDEYTQYYDILPFRFWYGKAREIAATAKNLPKIAFKSNTKDRSLRAIVENSDALYRSRLLQYQRTNDRNLLPGKYLYFEGTIEIEHR